VYTIAVYTKNLTRSFTINYNMNGRTPHKAFLDALVRQREARKNKEVKKAA